MRFLIFNSKGQANVAERKIWAILKRNYIKRGYSQEGGGVRRMSGGTTECWAVPHERLDGKWVFPHPEISMLKNDMDNGDSVKNACMENMVYRSIETYSTDWFTGEEKI